MPREDIAKNVLVEMGVPQERADAILDSIISGARQVGFIQSIKGKDYIYLDNGRDKSARWRQTVSKPLPDKVVSDMRSCGSAIIHVDAETVLRDKDDKEQIIINSNGADRNRRSISTLRQTLHTPS